jgi:tetratricopeptide (TPR) repeat protein
MRIVGLPKMTALLLALLALGCRLPGRGGPVPPSVADSRRFTQQGITALERGQQARAEGLLAQAVDACPVDCGARRYYAESLWLRGARAEAVTQMEEACRLAGDDATLWARLAEMQVASGKIEAARQNAQRAIDLDPRLAAAWTVRGRVMEVVGNPQEALANYLRALNYSPKDRGISTAIAQLYLQQRQPERALQTLQGITDGCSPNDEPTQVLFLLGQTYVALGRYEEGVESLAMAASREKPTPEMLFRLGEAELLAGHPPDAAVAARDALAMQPQHQPSRELLKRVEMAQSLDAPPRR